MLMFRSLKHSNFRLHFTGQAISLVGTWMQRVAVSWLVYRLTGSAFLLGLVTFLSLIPSLILSPFAGSFIDRHDRFRIVMITQIGLMLQAGVLAAMVWLNYYNMFWICILSAIQGIINAFDTTARQSLMIDLVDDKEDLPNAIALNSSAFNVARLLGPALAGIVLSTMGEDVCFLLNFLSFIGVVVCLMMMKIKTLPRSSGKENIWKDLRRGYDYLRESPDLSSLILMLGASSLFVIPYATLLPIFAKDVFNGNATTFSWFESAAGMGALVSGIYMARMKANVDLMQIVIFASSLFAVALIGLAFSGSLTLALLATVVSGIGLMTQNAAINTYLQTHASSEMRARTLSYYIMAYQGMLPLGSLMVGALTHVYGVQLVVLMEGIMGVLIVTGFLWYQRTLHHDTWLMRLVIPLRSKYFRYWR
jgi:MFS family permease